jgi:prolyl oligopeptidase
MSTRWFLLTMLLLTLSLGTLAADTDPWLWLEEVEGEKALSWAKEQNALSTAAIEAVDVFKPIHDRSLEIYDSEERIPSPTIRGDYVYNMWQDSEHERGIWRRTSLASYRRADPEWETVIDIDALVEAEGESWVFDGASCLPPNYRHCMVSLSPGGSDASVQREFDTVTKTFVENGFYIPKAKSSVSWKDKDTLWVGSDFGEGSLTTSGYPREIREWKRGTDLNSAPLIFECPTDHVRSWGFIMHSAGKRYEMVYDSTTFFDSEVYIRLGGRLVRMDIPQDAEFETIFKDHVLISLRSDWEVGETTYQQGSLLAIQLDNLLKKDMQFETLFKPTDRSSLGRVATTSEHVLMTTLDNVQGELHQLALADGKWTRKKIELPGIGSVSLQAASDEADTYFFTYEDFLTPDSLFLVHEGKVEKVKTLPAFFDTAGMKVAQHEATSADGTKIPYFLVTPKGFKANGKAPTMLYGYGGFEVSMRSGYSAIVGTAWLERGGVYVLANLRGGGEFGPRWHKAALQENRIKSFEDFIAIGEDLVKRKITSPRHLGIMGGSQGGLLVGGAFTMRPDLFNAVVCQVPLLDMQRFNKLLAGASWMSEYGDPDIPEQWAYIKTWSPYELVQKKAKYPKVFFWTNTRDDRVHPGHARKMVAKMASMGHPIYYFENIEGGHGTGTTNTQRAYVRALEYGYLWMMLGDQ